MRRIFDEYASGRGLHLIATGLNHDGIPSPSAHDPERNRHRAGGHGKWAKSAIRAILLNPRYTGFEVWNKQRKDEVLIDVDDVALGHVTKQRWNSEDEWIWSIESTHDAIVSRELFDLARSQFTKRGPTTRTPREGRHYVLSGLLHCAVCGRRMQGQWNHGRAYYRCKFTADYPGLDAEHPRSVYVQEDALIPGLDEWLGSLFDDDHLDDTCNALAGVSEPDPSIERRAAELRAAIADCDRKIRNDRRLLDDEDSVALAAGWIAETQRERKTLECQLGEQRSGDGLTTAEVAALVTALQDIVGVLAEAKPADKADLYAKLGVSLRYDPAGTVTVRAEPRGVTGGVGGGT